MLININDNWFDPAGIALKNDPLIRIEFGKEYSRQKRVKIIGNGWTLHVADKTCDEVAAEINHQIKDVIDIESGAHTWVRDDQSDWPYCQKCKAVKPLNGKNSECTGKETASKEGE